MRPTRSTMTMLLALALAPAPATAQDVFLTPGQLGEIFCIARLADDMDAASGLLTPGLSAAIAAAEAANEASAAAHPGDKPPLGDGVPWASYPDLPTGCAVGEPQWQMDEARLEISSSFEGAPDAAFTDTLLLRLIEVADGPKAWRIDNIVYAGGDDLRTTLLSAFMD